MIISISPIAREFTFNNGERNSVISFDSILKSSAWSIEKIILITWRDRLGQEVSCSLVRNSFLDNIAHHLPEHRAKEEDYDQDVLVYKLYRLLDGETEEEVQAEIDNVYEQRVKLENRKKEVIKEQNKAIVNFMEKKKAVMDRSAVLNDISYLVADSLEAVRVISHFESTGELLQIREDLTQRENMVEVWKMFTDVNAENVRNSVLLQEANDNLKFNRESLEADRASLEVAKEADKDKYQKGIERAGRMIQKYTDEADTLQAKIEALMKQRADLEKTIIEVLKETAVLSQQKFEELKTKLETMPDYPDLGEAPEDMPKLDFVVSEEMQKMVAVAQDEKIPDITLKNVDVDLANSALESTIKTERKTK